VPDAGLFPASVKVLFIHRNWSGPALAVEGALFTVTTTLLVRLLAHKVVTPTAYTLIVVFAVSASDVILRFPPLPAKKPLKALPFVSF
jgi:hypothetical protein